MRIGPFGAIGPSGPMLALALLLAGAPGQADEPREIRPVPGWRAVNWIAVGGGAEPESNQVSLEQDVALAGRVFAGTGRVLFAGGPDTSGVQVLRRGAKPTLTTALGDLFDPRGGRDAVYRPTTLAPDGPATLARVEQEIARAVRYDGKPLFLYFATHGEAGDAARENRVLLWGGAALTATRLAELLDAAPSPRRTALVSTACYSGGFAEIAFTAADPERGAPRRDRCGLFASEWNEQSSGCDPNPNRRAQESYGLHFLHALRGEDRNARALEAEAIDFDRNGAISLLEAHARTRIASRSFDVPTTTSERWLRHVAPADGPTLPVALPEEQAVIAALGRRLAVYEESLARKRVNGYERHAARVDAALAGVEERETQTYADLRIALLERWPVLDDPWHPDFQATFEKSRAAIEEMIERSPAAAAYEKARAAVDWEARRYDRVRGQVAVHRRLLRAYENRALAGRLRAAGGAAWEQYQRLLACERSAPREWNRTPAATPP